MTKCLLVAHEMHSKVRETENSINGLWCSKNVSIFEAFPFQEQNIFVFYVAQGTSKGMMQTFVHRLAIILGVSHFFQECLFSDSRSEFIDRFASKCVARNIINVTYYSESSVLQIFSMHSLKLRSPQ